MAVSFSLLAAGLAWQVAQPVWVVDEILISPGKKEAAMNYYRSAWLPARKEAVRTKLILDYKALLLDDDPKEGLHLILMTKFASRAEIAASEPAWQKILRQVAPTGSVLPPGLKSSDIRTIIRSAQAVEPFEGS